MKIVFMGGRQAGLIGLLTLLSAGHEVIALVPYDSIVSAVADKLQLRYYNSIYHSDIQTIFLPQGDLLVSVHGREVVEERLLEKPYFGGINVHPCLSQYKGSSPIKRLLEDGGKEASVGVHRMVQEVDGGEVLVEAFIDIGQAKTEEEVYNLLYPLYSLVLFEALSLL